VPFFSYSNLFPPTQKPSLVANSSKEFCFLLISQQTSNPQKKKKKVPFVSKLTLDRLIDKKEELGERCAKNRSVQLLRMQLLGNFLQIKIS
jgi:hypothetical protein